MTHTDSGSTCHERQAVNEMDTAGIGPVWGEPVGAEALRLVDERPLPVGRPSRRRTRRVKYRLGFARRTASLAELVILWAILAAIVSGVFAGAVAGISLVLHHLGG